MKIHNSKTLANIEAFAVANTPTKLMRVSTDMFLLWKMCEYFKPSTVLEIGFYAGQSLGIMMEASGPTTQIVSVDIDYGYKFIFDQVFIDDCSTKNITFVNIDSKNLLLDRQFDLIHIDGDHSYEFVKNDIQKCLPMLHKSSILCIDDYQRNSVMQAIEETLQGQYDFVPFLAGDQEIFFHHKSHSADQFLDEWIQSKSNNFIDFSNYEFLGYTVLRARMPNIFVDHMSMFTQALQLYNL